MICMLPSTCGEQLLSSGIEASMACMSPITSVRVVPVPVRRPLTVRPPASTQTRLSPSIWSCWWIWAAPRGGEAFAIASGLWVGGRVPVVLIQNTGLLETGDALRGTAMRMRVPLVCLVTYRGHATLGALGVAPSAETITGALLSRADV